MTQQEIQERNKEIALMLGKKYQNNTIVIHYNNVCGVNPTGETWQECLYHSDWNWLMEAVEFIKKNIRTSNNTENAINKEIFIDEWEFKVTKYYLRLIQWTNAGWRMFDNKNRNLSMLYVVGENCETEKEAVFKIVSDFAKKFNNKEL
jgi:L-lysine 2,3-aminomutase